MKIIFVADVALGELVLKTKALMTNVNVLQSQLLGTL
jgi:hypothetical protein